MESVLLALGGLAVLVVGGVVLLDRRLGRLQSELARLEQVGELAERVQGLAAEIDRKRLNAPLQSKITEFTEALRRQAAALAEIQQELDELRRARELLAGAADGEPDAHSADVAAGVREHLERQGFTQVQILSDLNRLQGRSGRVVFEAQRHGVMHKGHVHLADGAVMEENVRAAYSAFP